MTSRKYPLYTINNRTREIELKQGWYCAVNIPDSTGLYRFAISRNPSSRRGYAAYDVWTGLLILTCDGTRAKTEDLVKTQVERIQTAFEYHRRGERMGLRSDIFREHNYRLAAVIPEEAELPQGVYEYIYGDQPFTEV